MTFLHSTLLFAGLACVAIPIVIHLLFRRRRRPIRWAAMRFLLEAMRRQRRRLRLEQILLLVARCLLIALLAAAVARPMLRQAGFLGMDAGAGRRVYILIDNSLTASARDADGPATALDRHKSAAAALLASLGPGDTAGLIALAAPADGIVVPASADLSAVANLVNEIQPADSAMDLDSALQDIASAVAADEAQSRQPTVIVVLSDFLAGSADASRPLPPALVDLPNVTLLASPPASGAPANLRVTGVEPLRTVVLTGEAVAGAPDSGAAGAQAEQVRVTLVRSGATTDEAASTTLRLRQLAEASGSDGGGLGRPVAQTTVRWQPGQTEAVATLQVLADFASGSREAPAVVVAEIDRDPISGDNLFRRPVIVRDALDVAVVAQRRFGSGPGIERFAPADWLRLALRPADATPVHVTEIEPAAVDSPALAALDAVFIPEPQLLAPDAWTRLRRFADRGGLVVVSPPPDATVHLWTDAFLEAFSLDWRMAREPVVLAEEGGEEDARVARLDDQWSPGPLLSLIAPDLPQLVRSVSIMKILPVEIGSREGTGGGTRGGVGGSVLLALAPGSGGAERMPWLVAADPGASRAVDDAAGGGGGADGAEPHGAAPSRGLVVYLASAPTLAWTDLPARPLMVPLMQELLRQGVGRATGSSSFIAGRPISVAPGTAQLRAMDPGAEPAIVNVSRAGVPQTPLRRAGLWQCLDEAARAREVIAVNPDPEAGRTEAQAPEAVEAWLAGAGGAGERSADRIFSFAYLDPAAPAEALRRDDQTSPISLPLLIAAALIAVLETVMARYFSHALQERHAAPSSAEQRAASAAAA